MIAWARTWLFNLIFYVGSVPYVLATPISAVVGRRALVANVHGWMIFHRWAIGLILNVHSRFEGDLPGGPVLYAAKHHSMYETLELMIALRDPVVVIKQELSQIPVWGWAVQRYGAIVVDREGSAAMLRKMVHQARAALAENRSVLIFPEGTRVPQGAAPPLKSGFAGLYRALGLPVVPIAHDSGKVWPKTGPKRSGDVTFLIGAPIPPKLSRDEIEARTHAAINQLG